MSTAEEKRAIVKETGRVDGSAGKQSSRRNRVIVFSGVFDPIHNGHLSAAKKALDFGSHVVFLPERVPTHKKEYSRIEDRVAMIKLAIEGEEKFSVLESPFKHHTNDETLGWLRSKFKSSQNFGLLIGNDVADYIMKWPDIERISDYGVDMLIIVNRATSDVSDLPKIKIPNVKVIMMRAENDHITSSAIRQNFVVMQTSVPNEAANYALANKLY